MSMVSQKVGNEHERKDEWAPFVSPILSRAVVDYIQGEISADQYFGDTDSAPANSLIRKLPSGLRRTRTIIYSGVALALIVAVSGVYFAFSAETIPLTVVALLDSALLSSSLSLLAVRKAHTPPWSKVASDHGVRHLQQLVLQILDAENIED